MCSIFNLCSPIFTSSLSTWLSTSLHNFMLGWVPWYIVTVTLMGWPTLQNWEVVLVPALRQHSFRLFINNYFAAMNSSLHGRLSSSLRGCFPLPSFFNYCRRPLWPRQFQLILLFLYFAHNIRLTIPSGHQLSPWPLCLDIIFLEDGCPLELVTQPPMCLQNTQITWRK